VGNWLYDLLFDEYLVYSSFQNVFDVSFDSFAVPSYMVTEGMQARDYMPPVDIKENSTADKYSMPEQRLQQAPEVECVLEDHTREAANGFHDSTVYPMQEAPPSVIEESIEEPQKHTYASVVCVFVNPIIIGGLISVFMTLFGRLMVCLFI